MRKHEDRQTYRIGNGASLMLMIFMAVMLLTLGLLSLMSAKASQRQTLRRVQSAQAYYSADAAVERELARLDGILYALETAAADEEAYDAGLEALCQSLEWSRSEVNERMLTLEIPYGADQLIRVSVRVRRWDEEGARYSVISRRTDMIPGWELAYDSLLL